jgi:hypothetical protein
MVFFFIVNLRSRLLYHSSWGETSTAQGRACETGLIVLGAALQLNVIVLPSWPGQARP